MYIRRGNVNTDTCCRSHPVPFIQAYQRASIFAGDELRLDSLRNWPLASPAGGTALAGAGVSAQVSRGFPQALALLSRTHLNPTYTL